MSDNIATLEDLHERICDIEDHVEDSKIWLSLILDISDAGTYEWDVYHDKLSWDRNMHKVFGTTPEIFTGKSTFLFDNLNPEDRVKISEEFAKDLLYKESFDYTFRFISPIDGKERRVRTEGRIFRNLGRSNRIVLGVCAPAPERRKCVRNEDETEVIN